MSNETGSLNDNTMITKQTTTQPITSDHINNDVTANITPTKDKKHSTGQKVPSQPTLANDFRSINAFNSKGEAVLPEAPSIILTDEKTGKRTTTIPQQFFYYHRTRANLEAIIANIAFEDNFLLFVHEENNHLFLQVGIIGLENYPKKSKKEHTDDAQTINQTQTSTPPKIVYGRRWFIEPFMPTSEVIQTAFIALKKAREHELREFFHVMVERDDVPYRTTPFNTHMDLPLMADHAELFHCYHTSNQNKAEAKPTLDDAVVPKKASFVDTVGLNEKTLKKIIQQQLTAISFAGLTCQLIQYQCLDDLLILSIKLSDRKCVRTENLNVDISNTESTHLESLNNLTSDRLTPPKQISCLAHQYFPEQVNVTHHILLTNPFNHQTTTNVASQQAYKTHRCGNQATFKDIEGQEDISDLIDRLVDELIHQLFNAILKQHDSYVSEHFTYNGFTRFHPSISPRDIANFSVQTRVVDEQEKTPRFISAFRKMVAIVDGAKAPMYAQNTRLKRRQQDAVKQHVNLEGYLPYEDTK